MPSSDEMYDLGALDAQRDELNLFYYQHYFYYRQGYDTTRRRLRRGGGRLHQPLVIALGVVALIAGIAAGVVFMQPRQAPAAAPSAEVVLAPTDAPTAAPTAAPTVEPTLTASPEPPIRVGVQVMLANLGGSALRLRSEPSLAGVVQARAPEGSLVELLEGPVEADGLSWWRLRAPDGEGWAAEGGPGGETSYFAPVASEAIETPTP